MKRSQCSGFGDTGKLMLFSIVSLHVALLLPTCIQVWKRQNHRAYPPVAAVLVSILVFFSPVLVGLAIGFFVALYAKFSGSDGEFMDTLLESWGLVYTSIMLLLLAVVVIGALVYFASYLINIAE